jgi:hypothetical protein
MPNKLKLAILHDFITVILKGLKRYTKLQPHNWLAETPQGLGPRRLGRQSGGKGADFLIKWNNSDE